MRTVLLDPPAEIESWLRRRRELGQDRFDEVWDGEYHVAPAPHRMHGDVDDQLAGLLRPLARSAGLWPSGPLNVGDPTDYRVPDRAYLRDRTMSSFAPTVSLAVEIVSPDDESWAKSDFYFGRGVEELLIVDPRRRTVQWFARGGAGFEARPASDLLGITAEQITAELDWPPVA